MCPVYPGLGLLNLDKHLSAIEPGHDPPLGHGIPFLFGKLINPAWDLRANGYNLGFDPGIVGRDISGGSPPPDPKTHCDSD
jgi:hypothetical protein